MPQLTGIRLAIDLAKRRRDDAGAALLQARQGHAVVVGQMDQLVSYAAETEARWALASRASANPEIIVHYDQFMDRLQQAVDMQRAVVDAHLLANEAARQKLVEEEVRLSGLNRLLDKRRAALTRVRSGREQKELDDLSALQFRRLHAGAESLDTP